MTNGQRVGLENVFRGVKEREFDTGPSMEEEVIDDDIDLSEEDEEESS